LSSLYFDIDRGGNYIHGNIQNIKIFSVVAFFVLCLALINFINLSTATASVRYKEVGIRKVLGSLRTQLLKQFLFESIFLILSAAFIALLLVGFTKSRFFQIIGKHIGFSYLINPEMLAFFILFILLIGFISGIYPALFLSSFQPAKVLREGEMKGAKGGLFRKVMAVVQFAVSVVLIIGTFTVRSQLKFIQNKDLGFNQDQILWFELNDSSMKNARILKQRLASNPNVLSVATTNFTKPGIWSKWDLEWQEKQMDVNVF
jgi:putative ABC transport system permease protein